MADDRHPADPDASDVVEGPVGNASIKDPSVNPEIGAELDELEVTVADAQDDDAEGARPAGL